MARVSIVFHSGYGHTAELAKAVQVGAASVPDTETMLIPVADIEQHWDTLEGSDAIIFGAPTYMGSVSAQFKLFMEASSRLWFHQKWHNKIAAGFTNSGNQNGDKLSTLIALALFAMQHGMIWVGLDIVPGNNSSRGSTEDLNRLGCWLGAMAQSNMDQGPDLAPPQADRDTAMRLGARVAEVARQYVMGREN